MVWVEFPSIQGFIFRSRTLLDTIGRSRLIADLTGAEFVRGWSGDVVDVWASGVGSFGCELGSAGDARDFIGWYTRAVLEHSDALHPVIAVVDDSTLAASVARAAMGLRAARHRTAVGMAGEGAWGSVLCSVTSVPAAARELTSRVGAVARRARSDEVGEAEIRARRWHAAQQGRAVPARDGLRLELPTKLNELGRAMGESSKLAVIVADLNGVGALLGAVAGERVPEAGAALSALTEAWCDALVGSVCAKVRVEGDRALVGAAEAGSVQPAVPAVELAAVSGKGSAWFLPVRPWVSAGDDVVIVCESRLAWWLAEQLVLWLDGDPDVNDDPRARVDAVLGQRPTVSIGIAVVPLGLALSRAHALAAQVCANAKSAARRQSVGGRSHHGFDWHRGVLDAAALDSHRGRRSAGGVLLTRRPFTWSREEPGSGFSAFADAWLGSGVESLRGSEWSQLRSTVRDTLLAAVDRGTRTAANAAGPSDALKAAVDEVNRRRRTLRRSAVSLPANDAAAFMDALDLRDEYLRLS